MEACLVWRVGVLSAFGDVTGGASVWVEAWLVWGRGCLSAGVDALVVYTDSVIVLASTVATLG